MSHTAYMPDAALFPRAATGDGPALATLVERHAARLYDLAFRLTGDPARAAEAVASAFTGLATSAFPTSPDAPTLALESAVATAALALAGTTRGGWALRGSREPRASGAGGETVTALALLPARDRAILELTARRSLPDATVAALLNLPPERLGEARAATERAFNAAILLHRARLGPGACAELCAIGRSRAQERLPAAAAHLVTCPICAAGARDLPAPATALRALPTLPLTPEGADDILWRVTRTLRHETDRTVHEATPIETADPPPTMPAFTLDTRAGAPPTSARAHPQVAARLTSLLRTRAGGIGRRREGHSLDRYLRHRSPLRLLLPLALLAALTAAGAEHFPLEVGRGRPAEGAATVVTSRSTLPPRPTTVARVGPSPIADELVEARPARPATVVTAVDITATAIPPRAPAPTLAAPPATGTPEPATPTPARPTTVAAAPTGTSAIAAIGAVPTATAVPTTTAMPTAASTATAAPSRPQAPPIVSAIPSPAAQLPVMVTPQPAPMPTAADSIIPPAPSAVARVPVDTPAAGGTVSPDQQGTARLALAEGDFDFGLEAGPRTLRLANGGSAPLEWRVAGDSAWVSVTPAAGTIAPGETAQVEVTVVRGAFPAGNYTGALQVLTNGGDDLVPVTMVVAPAGTTSATATASPPPAPTASLAPTSTRTATATAATTRVTVTATAPTTAPSRSPTPSPTTTATGSTAPSPTRTTPATPSATTAPSPTRPGADATLAAASSPTTRAAPTATPSSAPRTPGTPRTVASPTKP